MDCKVIKQRTDSSTPETTTRPAKMHPLTFQTENVEGMREDMLALIANFITRNMNKETSTDYVKQHTYCCMVYTGDSFCLTGLVMVREFLDHLGKRAHELSSLCVDEDSRGRGLGSALLQHVRAGMRGNDYLKLFVDAGDTHDRLVAFYQRNGLRAVYTNDQETCMQTTDINKNACLGYVLAVFFLILLFYAVLSSVY